MENETNIETLSEEDNEYAQFVKSLLDHNPSDGNIAAWDALVDDDDDEEEYQADDDEEEEDVWTETPLQMLHLSNLFLLWTDFH
jgi:hypothetical protein